MLIVSSGVRFSTAVIATDCWWRVVTTLDLEFRSRTKVSAFSHC